MYCVLFEPNFITRKEICFFANNCVLKRTCRPISNAHHANCLLYSFSIKRVKAGASSELKNGGKDIHDENVSTVRDLC